MTNRYISRHGLLAIFMHWFNGLCWFFLLATGLGLINNPELQPLGMWWPKLMATFFGGPERLLIWHITVGIIWAVAWIVFLILPLGLLDYTLPFLKEIFTFQLPRDLRWLVKKQLQMVLGQRNMARLVQFLGWDGIIPDQGFYNTGQKVAAVPLVLGGLTLALTGIIMTASKYWLDQSWVTLVQWSLLIHFLAAGVTAAVLVIHIYMAAISREERPALWSMFTGMVPEDYARDHHRLWLKTVTKTVED